VNAVCTERPLTSTVPSPGPAAPPVVHTGCGPRHACRPARTAVVHTVHRAYDDDEKNYS